MSKHIIKKFINPGPISFVVFLVSFILFFRMLCSLGFELSDYLATHPLVSHVAAWVFVVIGIFACYFNLAFYTSWTFNRAARAYLFAALGMSGVYYIVFSLQFECFSLPGDISTSPSIVDFVYFSFVTVTTVGYGDITPLHTFVRVLVLFQVLFGLYLVLKCTQTKRDKLFE